jgi:hypothetical protein
MSSTVIPILSADIHGVQSHLEVTSASVSLEIQREAVNAIVTAKNSLPQYSEFRVLRSIRSHMSTMFGHEWICFSVKSCFYGSSGFGVPDNMPFLFIVLNDVYTFILVQGVSAASLRLSEEEGGAALCAANERIRVADAQAASALSKLDAAQNLSHHTYMSSFLQFSRTYHTFVDERRFPHLYGCDSRRRFCLICGWNL